MRENAEEVITELTNCPYEIYGIVKGLKTDSKEVVGGRCMRGSAWTFRSITRVDCC